jgi:hypothetical protein
VAITKPQIAKRRSDFFFKDILAGRIKLCQLSPLGNWNAGDEAIPFRIAPALFKAGRMSAKELVATFLAAGLHFEADEIAFMVNEDSWMIENQPL